MIHFLIPLRSAQTTSDWPKIQHLLNLTLASVFNQTSAEFKVMIACHEKPDISSEFASRVSVFQVDYPAPVTSEEQMIDKYYKKRLMMKEMQQYQGGYVMFTDADDLISNRLAAFVHQEANNNNDGWYFENGYEFHYDKNLAKKAPKFYRVCGTSYIIHFKPSELPQTWEFDGYKRENRYLFDHGHNEWLTKFQEAGKILKPLPFRGAMYVINTGENYMAGSTGFKRHILRWLTPGKTPDNQLKAEFKIPEIPQ